ncbi:MAG TPA: RNA polymerase sigma factor, partial [Acidimicrobiales bacterium]|nr:RNA polymerase sigma factor [Acidimicrobiales bacterium]
MLRRHHQRLHAVCRRMTGHAADAEDATQEALIKIVRGLPRFTGGSGFGTWAYRVAVNVCLDELRRRRRRPTPGLPEDDGAANGGATLGGSRPAPAPVESVVADRVDVDAALARVTPEFRAAVVLRDLCGLEYAEIAEVLDIPPGTVRSRIARGRAAVADLMGGNLKTPPERPIPSP